MEFITDTLFPTGITYNTFPREVTSDEKKFVETCSKTVLKNSGNVTSENRYVLNEPEFSSLKEYLQSGIDHYVNEIIKPREQIQFYITQSWLNYTNTGGHHHKHEHPNSIISGVYYFNADPENDKIHFLKNEYKQIYIPSSEHTPFNSEAWWFPVHPGKLILFPSHLTHTVEQTVSTSTRVSLAFNVFAKGFLGDEKELTALKL
jgi:uncharacterized protein (TIGR02466 family)